MDRERSNPPQEEIYARKWAIFGVTMIGLFMALLDLTIVNISIPELQRDLKADVDTTSWVLNAYNITFAVLLVTMGRLADQFGRKRFFMIGLAIFTAGSLLCALAGSIHALVGFRALQAIGAGVLAPIAAATATMVFPPHQRGLGLASMAMVANLAATVGPPVGGVIIDVASWEWIFAINVPIGIFALVAVARVMPETYDLAAGRRVDWWGAGLIGGAIFCLTYGLVEANRLGWGSTEIVSLFAGFVVLLALFALSQRYGRNAMLSPALLRNHQFVTSSATLLIFGMAMMGEFFLIVIALVTLWDYSELEAALAITPIAVIAAIASPLVGRAVDRRPPRALALPAIALMAGGLLWWGLAFPARPDYLAILAPMIMIGLAIGAAFPSIMVGAMGSIRGQELGLGSGIVNMSRQVGFAIGIAIVVAVFTATVEDRAGEARAQTIAVAREAGLPPERTERLIASAFRDPSRHPGEAPFHPVDAVGRRADQLVREARRDAFEVGFLVAALITLLAAPFAFTMRRMPAR